MREKDRKELKALEKTDMSLSWFWNFSTKLKEKKLSEGKRGRERAEKLEEKNKKIWKKDRIHKNEKINKKKKRYWNPTK